MATSTVWDCDGPGCDAATKVDVFAPPPAGWIRLERIDVIAAQVDGPQLWTFHSWGCLAALATARRDATARIPDPGDQVAAGHGYATDVRALADEYEAQGLDDDARLLRTEAAGRGPITLPDPAGQAELDALRARWSDAR
jgi:hypothetical protein